VVEVSHSFENIQPEMKGGSESFPTEKPHRGHRLLSHQNPLAPWHVESRSCEGARSRAAHRREGSCTRFREWTETPPLLSAFSSHLLLCPDRSENKKQVSTGQFPCRQRAVKINSKASDTAITQQHEAFLGRDYQPSQQVHQGNETQK